MLYSKTWQTMALYVYTYSSESTKHNHWFANVLFFLPYKNLLLRNILKFDLITVQNNVI